MTEGAIVELTDGHLWEITTENGTRHLIDLRDRDTGTRRMRLPGPGQERGREDNAWIPKVGAIYHRAVEDVDDYGGREIVIGEPCRIIGPGVGDWHMTTNVVAVRRVTDAPDAL